VGAPQSRAGCAAAEQGVLASASVLQQNKDQRLVRRTCEEMRSVNVLSVQLDDQMSCPSSSVQCVAADTQSDKSRGEYVIRLCCFEA